MNIKPGVSTWLWSSPFTTETIKLFPKIKEIGYDVVETPVEDPALINVKKVKEALDKNGLEATICGAFGASRDFTNDGPSYHKESFQYIESCLNICNVLG